MSYRAAGKWEIWCNNNSAFWPQLISVRKNFNLSNKTWSFSIISIVSIISWYWWGGQYYLLILVRRSVLSLPVTEAGVRHSSLGYNQLRWNVVPVRATVSTHYYHYNSLYRLGRNSAQRGEDFRSIPRNVRISGQFPDTTQPSYCCMSKVNNQNMSS